MKNKLFMAAVACFAALNSTKAQVSISQDGNNYSLQSGKCTMIVAADKGGKVISLQCNQQELIAQHKQKTPEIFFENPNDFGSTFWPSPQSTWNWPPIATYDSKSYTAKADKKQLTLTSEKDSKYPYIFEKTYKPLGKGSYDITYTIRNASNEPVKVAPWEITRVPSGGFIYFDAPAIRPATEMTYTSEMNWQWIQFIAKERQNRKIFADAKGWLAFANDGLLFVKQFPDITTTNAAPDEDEVEIYFNMGNTYTEIENQGAYITLQPNEQTTWTVRWTLQQIDKKATKTELKTATETILKNK
ncbi:MAG: DUF4380 domain-containing protein [Bacteroidaceae bacterium]|nr:DUF4380 domain-containing protein [Bacteroidaceae bacterium]